MLPGWPKWFPSIGPGVNKVVSALNRLAHARLVSSASLATGGVFSCKDPSGRSNASKTRARLP